MEFSLYKEEGEDMVEGVENFKYLWRTLDQTDDDWPAVWLSIMRARSVWGRLGTLIIWKGAETKVSVMFYRAVIQLVLLFGADTWLLLAAMEWKAEGTHTGFLRQIMWKRARRFPYGT